MYYVIIFQFNLVRYGPVQSVQVLTDAIEKLEAISLFKWIGITTEYIEAVCELASCLYRHYLFLMTTNLKYAVHHNQLLCDDLEALFYITSTSYM